MSPFNSEGDVSALVISQTELDNSEYTCIIVDLWQGVRDDPSTKVLRYMGLFNTADLSGLLEREETLRVEHYYGEFRLNRNDRDKVLVWSEFQIIKEQDRDALAFKTQSENLMDANNYSNRYSGVGDLYQKFIAAIDVLAQNYEDEEAWKAVDEYRNYQATMHEK